MPDSVKEQLGSFARRFMPVPTTGPPAAIWLVVLTLIAVRPAAGAECLVVKDNSVEEVSANHGITTAEWSASVQNRCDAPYDGTLTIRLKDSDGEVMYEAVQIVVVEGGESNDTSRSVNIASDQFSALEEVDVVVEERERPR